MNWGPPANLSPTATSATCLRCGWAFGNCMCVVSDQLSWPPTSTTTTVQIQGNWPVVIVQPYETDAEREARMIALSFQERRERHRANLRARAVEVRDRRPARPRPAPPPAAPWTQSVRSFRDRGRG